MEFRALDMLALLSIAFLSFYYYLTCSFDFWKKRNVRGPKPIPLFGNFKDVILGKIHRGLLVTRFYHEFKNEPVVGIFRRSSPRLIIRDLDLIRDVLIKDFPIFADRGVPVNEKSDPQTQNLVNLEHERWRPLRMKLSPIFTSGKLRQMFYLMIKCAERFEDRIEKLAQRDEPVECRELTAKFTLESIGLCVFGINTNALSDENSEFEKCGRSILDISLKTMLRRAFREIFPNGFLSSWLQNNGMRFLVKSFRQTVHYRRKNNVRRNDFVDLLMELQAQPEKLSSFEFTDSLVTGQVISFFAAGVETSSTTMSNALYELALHQNIQDKLREEIKNEIQQNEGTLTYDSIKRMSYLNKIIKETLRKYPVGTFLTRMSLSSYTFSGTKVSIPKGTTILIPVQAIHHDGDIFPDPEVFDPERFNEENEISRHPMTYLPFGDGPHNCIGARFASYQMKIGIIALLNKFKVEVCDETCMSYHINPRSLVPTPIDGIKLKIVKV